jgi:serine/threonine protein phosphatase PrpC
VAAFPGGVVVAVVDGIGHGEEAMIAAQQALAIAQEHAQEGVIPLLLHCHEQLKGTRGVVMSVATFTARDSLMTWLGVGDVEGVLVRTDTTTQPPREFLPLRGGVIGYQLPPLRATTLSVGRADLLIFATDGLHNGFVHDPQLQNPLLRQARDGPQQLADALLTQYGKATDDALVFVARYRGATS